MPQSRVLIVDDQSSIAYLTAAMASTCDCEVRVATQGADAVQVAADWQPQIVLLDLLMPDPNGFEVARQLREKLPGTKIVAVTALPPDDPRLQNADFDRYLLKPVLKETLGQVIRQLTHELGG